MPAEVKKEIELKIAHVLFIDIVAYSKMASDDQRAAIEKLNQIVQSTDEFRKAEGENRLLKLATGDGMALIFYDSPEAPVECALEISRALKEHPQLRLRMGAHSGPVSGVVDVNGRANVAGAGINMAQRVMDCGDAGHILLSQRIAEDLEQFKHWRPHLYHLGACEVKHGEKVDIVNLFTAELGNREVPEKFQQAKATLTAPAIAASEARPARRSWSWTAALIIVAVLAAAAGFYISSRRTGPKAPPSASAPTPAAVVIPEKSIAVLPFENLIRWTEGRALVATGSPFAPVNYGGRAIPIAQCNNVYIFPAIGLGVVASGARRVSDAMMLSAARALAENSPALKDSSASLLPPLTEIRKVATEIALAVGLEAQREGLAPKTSEQELRQRVGQNQWMPAYPSDLAPAASAEQELVDSYKV